jgi:hypothetical protein
MHGRQTFFSPTSKRQKFCFRKICYDRNAESKTQNDNVKERHGAGFCKKDGCRQYEQESGGCRFPKTKASQKTERQQSRPFDAGLFYSGEDAI